MPSFKLYTGNRLELLLDALAHTVKEPHKNPLAPEIIVTRNKGMQRWISMQLAKKLGVWADCSFFFPDVFVENIFSKAIDLSDESPLEPETMTWKIMELLPGLIDNNEFASIRSYLNGAKQLKLYQLASQIADTFDQYTLYRPDMVLEWEHGADDCWQAVLWRTLTAQKPTHRAGNKKKLVSQIVNKTYIPPFLSNRISIFGISFLPPFHVEIIQALSSVVDIHLFILNPCAEYWDDVLSEREIGRITKKKGKRIIPAADLHWESGNVLLSSFGGYGRDFLARLHNLEGEEFQLTDPPCAQNLLTYIQSDILHLQQRGENGDTPVIEISPLDDSIQIHSCHGPLREIEILYDNLLRRFDLKKDLLPSDIIVMTPDIEAYSPFINAVFGSAENKRMRIPYTIADRGIRAESPVINAFLSLMSIVQGRCTASEIMSLLETRQIREAFNINESDISRIRIMITETRVRWGLDEKSQASLDIPAFPENTWEAGLESMLLGYAMTGNNTPFMGIIPCESVEGNTELLSNFLDFIHSISDLRSAIAQPHTLSQWNVVLLDCISHFFAAEEYIAAELEILRKAFNDLAMGSDYFKDAVSVEVILARLGSTLKSSISSSGFLSGVVTFCEMLPMRSIPFRIICIIGMNDGVFPRMSHHAAWNLIAAFPKNGDRALEKEDRYIFLEAILSAREMLYISYSGRNAGNDSVCRPSTIVSELCDYIDSGFKVSGDEKIVGDINADYSNTAMRASEHITFHHRLQAFNPSYFIPGNRLFSYSMENFNAAENFLYEPKSISNFFTGHLIPPSKEWHEVNINDLCSFYSNPARFIMEKRMGMHICNPEEQILDKEPFFIEGLEGYRTGQEIVKRFLNKESRESCYEALKAASALPHGNVGKGAFDKIADEASVFADRIISLTESYKLDTIDIQVQIDDFLISGHVENIVDSGVLMYRFAHVKPVDLLKFWIKSLAVASANTETIDVKNILLAMDSCLELSISDNVHALLKSMLDIYWRGLSFPIHFFPKASHAFAESIFLKNKTPVEAVYDAKTAWIGDDYTTGEITDPYIGLCFGKQPENALDEEFKKISAEIFEPLFEHIKTYD
jgi:exodeoxyribonuclease V gamma subunit